MKEMLFVVRNLSYDFKIGTIDGGLVHIIGEVYI
jgi:hypothetical protein